MALQEDAPLRRAACLVLAAHWSTVLDAGNFVGVERELATWSVLANEPGWAAARARAWILQGQDGVARTILDAALLSTPGDATCLRLLAMVLWRQGEATAAERCWKRLIDAGGAAAVVALEQYNALRLWNAAAEPVADDESAIVERDMAPHAPDTTHAANPLRRSVG
jgi:hypothetical protein